MGKHYDNKKNKKSFAKDNEKYSSSRNAGGKNSRRGNDRARSIEARDEKGFNSPEWLTHNPELTEAAGRINFATRLGKEYRFRIGGGSSPDELYAVPGLPNPSFLALYYVPTFGNSLNSTSALNLSATGMATHIRTVISGSRSYDPSDLMVHILALSNIVDAINIAVRAYGVATYYNTWDTIAPREYLEAMGFDADDVTQHMAYFNGLINKAILRLGNMAIPASIKYLNRHAALSANIFADGGIVHRAQKYFFVPTHFYKLYLEEDVDGVYGGYGLEPIVWFDPINSDAPKTIDQWFEMVDGMLDTIVNREDCWIIDGDIRKAYSDELVNLSTIPFDYKIIPAYDAGMSSQFENASIVGFNPSISMARNPKSWRLRQNMGYNGLEIDPVLSINTAGSLDQYVYPYYHDQSVLNFHWENPSSTDVAYATQFTVCTSGTFNEEAGQMEWRFDSTGTEVIAYAKMRGYSDVDSAISYIWSYMDRFTFGEDRVYATMTALSVFDWHPQFIVFDSDRQNAIVGTNIDLDNWTFIEKFDLAQLHDAALLSYFNVPSHR